MAKPFPFLKPQFFDDNGVALAGGQLFTYIAGTSTPLTTYTDSGGLTPNENPLILDASGRADIWLGARSYKFVLKDVDDVVLWTVDNVDGTEAESNETSPWASHAVTDGQAAAALTGETVDFATYTSAFYDVEIKRGTTVLTNGTLAIQNLNGTGRVTVGGMMAEELHGVIFSVSQAALIVTLKAALDAGAGDGTIKLSRRLVPV